MAIVHLLPLGMVLVWAMIMCGVSVYLNETAGEAAKERARERRRKY